MWYCKKLSIYISIGQRKGDWETGREGEKERKRMNDKKDGDNVREKGGEK